MYQIPAPGLSADWLNAWLASLGICVLMPDVRLAWSERPVPSAVFFSPVPEAQFIQALTGSLPSEQALSELAIARRSNGRPEFARTVTLESYRSRAELARERRDDTLSASVTDLVATEGQDGLPHSPFDPAAPRGITLWERVVSCRKEIVDPATAIQGTLAGRGCRVALNGLGFDVRRLVAGVVEAEKTVDPVIELLAFQALALFPVRGYGGTSQTAIVRGWDGAPSRPGAFEWCAWRPPLDRWAIDALLDLLPRWRTLGRREEAALARLGVSVRYRSVPYNYSSASDPTRAYGSERV